MTGTDQLSDQPRLAYRLLTGVDDAEFCRRVSAALAEGYRLHGSPSITFNGTSVIAAQAVVLPLTPESGSDDDRRLEPGRGEAPAAHDRTTPVIRGSSDPAGLTP